MTDNQITHLEWLLATFPNQIFWWNYTEGRYEAVIGISHNHKSTSDPQEIGEPVFWTAKIAKIGKPAKATVGDGCNNLWGADPNDFHLFQEIPVNWPTES